MKATKKRKTKFEELIYELLGDNPKFEIEREKGGRIAVKVKKYNET